MFKVFTDHQYNTLIIILKGVFGKKEVEELYATLKEIIPKLNKDFKMITDLSLLDEMDIEAHKTNEKIMELCSQQGVAKIVRVIPDPAKDMGFNIMSLFHHSKDVIILASKSFDEAKKHIL